MHVENIAKTLQEKADLKRVFQFVLLCSLVMNILLGFSVATNTPNTRTVMLPPLVTKSFWVDDKTVSPEYLEQMGRYLITLYATVSPTSADMQMQELLKYVHPSVHGAVQEKLLVAVKKIKSDSLSYVFWPSEVSLFPDGNTMRMTGLQDVWVAGKKIEPGVVRTYQISLNYSNGQTTIKDLKEIKDASHEDQNPTQ